MGIAITEDDIERVLRLNMGELVPKIEFWEEYQKLQGESNKTLQKKIIEFARGLINQEEKRIKIIEWITRIHKIYITNNETNILVEYNLMKMK